MDLESGGRTREAVQAPHTGGREARAHGTPPDAMRADSRVQVNQTRTPTSLLHLNAISLIAIQVECTKL
jgi:hypothetical protein